MADGNKRIVWIDALKGFAIISVVIGHVLLGYVQNNAYPDSFKILHLFQEWIYSWHMPLFFVLSGFAYRASCLKGDRPEIRKILRSVLNLLIVYLIFDTIHPILKTIFGAFVNHPANFADIGKGILLPNSIMWYLWVLMIYYFVFYLV